MSAITFPATLAAQVRAFRWSQLRLDTAFSSTFGGQSIEVSSPLWGVQLSSIKLTDSNSGEWKSLLMNLKGRVNQLALWDIGRPAPIGTMRGTMTLNTAIAQGDITISIVASGENSKTLVAGDMLGVGAGTTQQVVMVTANATSHPSTGVITANIYPPFRNAHSIAAAVTWDKPKALFRQSNSTSAWDYEPAMLVSGFSLDLVEDIRP